MLQRCFTCEWTHKKNIEIVEINTTQIYEYGMRGLERALGEKLEAVNKKCSRCVNNLSITFTAGMHLFIDVKCLQWTKLAERMGYPNWTGMFTLPEIPTDIRFCNATYKLIAGIYRIYRWYEYKCNWTLHCTLSSNIRHLGNIRRFD